MPGGDAAQGVPRLHRVDGPGRGECSRLGLRCRGGRRRRLLGRLLGDDRWARQRRAGEQRCAADADDGGHQQAGQLLRGGEAGQP
ncbi:hypothetical protein [Geodermatophilus aquaeductus]|uniref:hypothetical protein n=1 Tax=Geodermatophilus aquaeductus TaxID=1564161 RepID=UPI001FE34C5A|nr:hypothetical protein [Geodermatophilus aquaeductus]